VYMTIGLVKGIELRQINNQYIIRDKTASFRGSKI
jgi:hypothetical protein